MEIFLEIEPPTATAQMKKVRMTRSGPVFYEPEKVKEAKRLLTAALLKYMPKEPFEGPLELTVDWFFRPTKTHKSGEWRATRPDTDNLEKMLKDCMTKTGYWRDDAQVAVEHVSKSWRERPGIRIKIERLTS